MNRLLLFLVCAALQVTVHAEDLKPDRKLLYKTVDEVELKLHVFDPVGLFRRRLERRRPETVLSTCSRNGQPWHGGIFGRVSSQEPQ